MNTERAAGGQDRQGVFMTDVEQIAALIGDVYDAALDASRWSNVLEKARHFVGGSTASVFAKDASSKSGMLHYESETGIDPSWTQLYYDKYVKLDPLMAGHVLAEIEQPICTSDIMLYEEFAESRAYREWVRPQGLVDCAIAVLDKSATGAALFGVFRHERHGLVDDATRWRMRRVTPHIRRAMMIGRTVEARTTEAATFVDALDGLSAGMFLVDDTGRIVHANASGHAMTADGSALRATGGRLAPADPEAAHALNEVLTVAGGGDAAVGVKGIAVPLTGRDGASYAAHVLPLTSGERQRAGARHAAVAAVFLRKATLETASLPETIARHYRLTATELRVLLAIVEVGGVPETAEALGIGEATVKTHLQRLFGKTRTNRQADLVKLVAGFANPLVS
jgi:DNA-binding CsgD family transcriptional regulator